MLRYLIICALISHSIWAKPVQQIGELASHLVIVTPQAQVHLEPLAAKYGAPATFIHHLSPLARIAAPHDETIIYVPAGAAAPVIPIEALAQQQHHHHHQQQQQVQHVGRSSSGDQPLTPQLKQDQNIQQNIQQAINQAQQAAGNAQTAAQEGFGMISEQFAEAAASFSPGSFFPPPSSGSGGSSGKDEKIETPANTQPLLAQSVSGRQFYAIAAPAIPHIVDFVHSAPVLVSHVSAIRARSLDAAKREQEPEVILDAGLAEKITPQKEILKSDLQGYEIELIPKTEQREKAVDVGRFLEANALKDADSKPEKFSALPLEQTEQKEEAGKLKLKEEQPSQSELKQPLLKSILDGSVVGGGGAGGDAVESAIAPKVVDPVVEDVVVV